MICLRLVLMVLMLGAGLCGCVERGDRLNELRIGVALEPPNLDPTAGAAAATDEIVYANIFEGLTRIGANGGVYPALASSWSIDADGLGFEFSLRENVLFHDGTSFDAQDVKFSLDRARAPGSTNAQPGLFSMIKDVKILNPYKVRIELRKNTADLLFNLAWGDAVIVAPETAGKNGYNPIGTGPFKFERWQKGQLVRLEKNPNYWGDAAKLDAVSFKFIPDSAAAYAALIAGDVDGFPNFPAPELLPLLKKNTRFKVTIGVTEGETILGLNNAKPPFDNILIRRAIGHAIDRNSIIEGAMFGEGTPIGSFFSPLHPAYKDFTKLSEYNSEKARELLALAGMPDGFTTSIKIPPTNYARRSGEIIAAQLGDVGIGVNIQYIEWAQWLDQVLGNHNYDMTIVSHTEARDLGFFARENNYFEYKSERFVALMEAIDDVRSEKNRFDLYRQAQLLLAKDAPVAFLFQLPKLGVWREGIEGYWHDAPIQANDMTHVFIHKAGATLRGEGAS